jgi:cysteinyl-tRNA synthetase
LARLDECLTRLRELAGPSTGNEQAATVSKFAEALDHDLNISGAWAVVFDWVRDTNKRLAEGALDSAAAAHALATWDRLDSVLGVGKPREIEVPPKITALLEARQAARQAKDFKRSDAIRDELKAKGWIIEDTPKGARVKPA